MAFHKNVAGHRAGRWKYPRSATRGPLGGQDNEHKEVEKQMRKVLLSAMALALVATMVGFGVHAQYYDAEVANTTIDACKGFDLLIKECPDGGWKNGEVLELDFDGCCIEPSNYGFPYMKMIKLKNDGPRCGVLRLEKVEITSLENDCREPEQAFGDDPLSSAGELENVLYVKITADSDLWPGKKLVYDGLLKDLPSATLPTLDNFMHNQEIDWVMEAYKWPADGNDKDTVAMTDSVKVKMTFSLTQW